MAELSTRQIAESVEAKGMVENRSVAKTGGGIARKARLDLEARTGQKVISSDNYLSPMKAMETLPMNPAKPATKQPAKKPRFRKT